MKCAAQLVLVLAVSAVLALEPKPTSSSLQYAALHLDRILADPELVQGYFECLMDKGPCTPGGTDLKSILPDAFATECASCNEHQKSASVRVLQFATEKRPELLDLLLTKYDPAGAFKSRAAAKVAA